MCCMQHGAPSDGCLHSMIASVLHRRSQTSPLHPHQARGSPVPQVQPGSMADWEMQSCCAGPHSGGRVVDVHCNGASPCLP